MVPKKIHFCWFSNDPYPELVVRCMESWHQMMPDYELVKWDMDRIKDIDSVWLQECLSVRKWAFAADFVRLWAVYHEGGIYLDSDVVLHKPLDEFCDNRMFIGREDIYYGTIDAGVQVFLTSHCFGAEAGHPFLKLCMDYYLDRHFIESSSENVPKYLRYDMMMMPYIQCRLAELFGYDARLGADHVQHLSNDVTVYPSRMFGRCRASFWKFGSYAEHIGSGSWNEQQAGYGRSKVGPKAYTIWYKISWRLRYLLDYLLAMRNYVLVKLPYNK